jgi:electron transport complex protein RnfG
MKIKYLQQAWLVLSLAIVFGAGLSGVQIALSGKIQANIFAETMGQIPSLVPGAEKGEEVQIEGRIVYRAIDTEGSCAGWVIPASGPGYADAINLLIGVDREARTITGLYVLGQKETPQLGNKITEAGFQDQFAGKRTSSPLSTTKIEPAGESEVLAITGATVSSRSVVQIVNETISELRDKLAAGAEQEFQRNAN